MVEYSSNDKGVICMEKELTVTIEFIFFVVIALTGVALLIFCLRRKEERSFDWDAFERTIKMIHEQTDENLDMLSKMNKEKNKIEEQIRDKKKKLGMKLVD